MPRPGTPGGPLDRQPSERPRRHSVPVLVVNPRDDLDFVALVERHIDGVREPDALQERLRETHPSAVVRARELAGETSEVWYVYRDGRWVWDSG